MILYEALSFAMHCIAKTLEVNASMPLNVDHVDDGWDRASERV